MGAGGLRSIWSKLHFTLLLLHVANLLADGGHPHHVQQSCYLVVAVPSVPHPYVSGCCCYTQQQGSHARRWGMLHRFDAGRIANTKSMNEDLTEIPTEQLHSCSIDPASIAWQPRRQG